MADQPQDQEQEGQQQPPQQSTPTPDNKANDTVDGKKQTETADQKNDQKDEDIKPIAEEKTKWTRAEKIAATSAGLSFIAAVVAASAFFKTAKIAGIAEENLKDARRKDSAAAIRNHINDSLAYIQFENTRRKDSILIELSQQSVNAQINSVQKSQSLFDKENRPFLQLVDFQIDTFVVNKKTSISFRIINLGKYPVRILDSKMITTMRVAPPPYNAVFGDIGSVIALNAYITFNTPYYTLSTTSSTLTESQYIRVKSGEWFFYTTGYIKYVNLNTNQISVYRFQVRTAPGADSHFIINEN